MSAPITGQALVEYSCEDDTGVEFIVEDEGNLKVGCDFRRDLRESNNAVAIRATKNPMKIEDVSDLHVQLLRKKVGVVENQP